jgi:hypothetical protein
MKFSLIMYDLYEIEANDIDEATDKLIDFVSGKDVSGIELVSEQETMEYPEN